ncbi:hypothetical protein HK097_007964 [Rhizophlyctis rosea]|uniref:Pre-rRNA-processing protein RIX1 n=1 Tax=Rhizophlyctis rosea TaxID=64517 RepID=A0AAD5SLD5_9FUNG|nr:hypothetical protein HK097_007964 [Rhizophlyctis rosea]
MALGGDPATSLNLILSSFLANEAAIPQSLPLILNALVGLAPIVKVDQLASVAEEQPQNVAANQASALLKKWTLRVNTLLQSKDQKIRWAATHLAAIFTRISKLITTFPGATKSAFDPLTKTCLRNLSTSPAPEYVEAISQCLLSIYSAEDKSESFAGQITLIDTLCGSVHAVLDAVLSPIQEETFAHETLPTFDLTPLGEDYTSDLPALVSRLDVLVSALLSCLRSAKTVNTHMRPETFLGIVRRVYDARPSCLPAPCHARSEVDALFVTLPRCYMSINKLLSAVVESAPAHMSAHSNQLWNFSIRGLEVSAASLDLRKSVYQTIKTFIIRIGFGLTEDQIRKHLVAILQDVQPDVAQVAVNVDVASQRQTNKKRKWQAVGSAADSPKDEDRRGVKDGALDLLEHILSLGFSIPAVLRSKVNHTIISLLITIGSDLVFTAKRTSESLDEQNLQHLRLLRCLMSSIMHTEEGQESVLVYGMRLFGAFLRSPVPEIRGFCTEALNLCDLIIHPKLPPLQRLRVAPTSVPVAYEQLNNDMDLDEPMGGFEAKRPRFGNGLAAAVPAVSANAAASLPAVVPPVHPSLVQVAQVAPVPVLQPAPVAPAPVPSSLPFPVPAAPVTTFNPATVAAPFSTATPVVVPVTQSAASSLPQQPSALPAIVPPTTAPTAPFSSQTAGKPQAPPESKSAPKPAPYESKPSTYETKPSTSYSVDMDDSDDEPMPTINIDSEYETDEEDDAE